MKKAFTLIELLVVIAIIGLLVIIIAIPINRARRGASIARILQYEASLHRYLGSDIVGWWKFDDPEDRYKDISGHNNHGSCTSCPDVVDGVPWKEGEGVSFNNNAIMLGDINDWEFEAGESFTISVWINVNSNKNADIFGRANASWSVRNWTWNLMQYSSGNIGFGIGNGENSNFRSVFGITTPGKWQHLIVTVPPQNNFIKFYINGEYQKGRNLYRNIGQLRKTSNSFQIGSGFYSFNGLIDDVRIYSRVLTSEEINTLYTETKNKYFTKQ